MIRKRITILFFLVVILGLFAASRINGPAAAANNRQVWVYYLGFWGGGPSWDAQSDVLTDYPQIGKYDSRDAGVAGTQIDQAKSAGIDAFIVSWFGIGEGVQTTPVLNNMLDRAAERGFHVAAAVDVFNPAFNRNRDELVQSLRYLVNDRANHPGYLRYNGKPVIIFAFQDRIGFSASEWQSVRNEVDPNHTTLWIAEGLNGCCLYSGTMDGMYAFNLAWANGATSRFTYERNAVANRGGSFYAPTIHPGWDEDRIAAKEHRPNPTSRRDRANGQFLSNSFKNAASLGTDVIMIVSWNEFLENSHIEPSQNYGTQSLDILRPLIASWKGSPASNPVPAAPNPPGGQVLEATTTVNVRTGPSTSNAIIGQIRPGTTYAVIQQVGSWYAISFNGQTGYVYAPLTRISGGSPSGSPSGVPASPPSAPASGQGVEAVTTVNVRSGPSTGYGILGQIRPGTVYPIVSQQPLWYGITYNGQLGYVSALFVKQSNAAPALPGGAIINLVANPSLVSAGGCATVAWAVDNVTAIYFQGQGVTGHESRQVCPAVSTTYTLNVILLDGTTTQRQVTVTVK